jgi:RimJ/RimL family protein N-acetyltransferase
MPLTPVSLHGSIVSLEPLTQSRLAELSAIGLHPDLWRLQPRPMLCAADMQGYVEQALADQARGISLPFTIVRRADQAVLGSTRFMDIALEHRRLEIGATWLTPLAQRTGANVEAKLLLLSHAFDTSGVQKVVFKTEALNTQSRTAILALGAVEEGTFRRHLIAENGRMRDMVYFSILDAEWPAVRANLRGRLARYAAPVAAVAEPATSVLFRHGLDDPDPDLGPPLC